MCSTFILNIFNRLTSFTYRCTTKQKGRNCARNFKFIIYYSKRFVTLMMSKWAKVPNDTTQVPQAPLPGYINQYKSLLLFTLSLLTNYPPYMLAWYIYPRRVTTTPHSTKPTAVPMAILSNTKTTWSTGSFFLWVKSPRSFYPWVETTGSFFPWVESPRSFFPSVKSPGSFFLWVKTTGSFFSWVKPSEPFFPWIRSPGSFCPRRKTTSRPSPRVPSSVIFFISSSIAIRGKIWTICRSIIVIMTPAVMCVRCPTPAKWLGCVEILARLSSVILLRYYRILSGLRRNCPTYFTIPIFFAIAHI